MFASAQDLFAQGNVAALGQVFGVNDAALWAKLQTVPALRPAIYRRYAALMSGDLDCPQNEFAFFKYLLLTPVTAIDQAFTTVACLHYAAEIKTSLDGQLLKDVERISGHPGFVRFLFQTDVPTVVRIERAEIFGIDALDVARRDFFALICAIAPRQVRAHLATAFPYACDTFDPATPLTTDDRRSVVMLFSLAAALEEPTEGEVA